MRKLVEVGSPIILGVALVFVFVVFWFGINSAASEPPSTDLPIRHATPTHSEPTISQEERIAQIEASMRESQERARLAAEAAARADDVNVIHASSQPRRHLTAVQAAPSYFPGFEFTEIAARRRRQAASFNRHLPEVQLIGDDEALYNVTLLVLSRGIVHEANFPHRPCGEYHTACDTALDHNHAEFDGPAMYAVFRHTRGTGETLVGAIRRHMRYVTEQVPPVRERSRWITELQLDGNRPAHFPETDAEGNALNWDRDYRPRWEMTIALARELLAGHHLGVCATAPLQTWGGRCEDDHGACDDNHGSHRGLVGMSCGDSSNRFWCRPGTRGCEATDPVPESPENVAEAPEASPTTTVETPVETIEIPTSIGEPIASLP